jgi:predicted membrane channel-forming protein YqfA (hemolysin III family)
LLEAVPMAAANGDHATVATAYALSSGGVFARIFPLAAAPLAVAGIGFALTGTSVLPRLFARAALLVAGLFLIAGLAAVFATAGLILAVVMSVAEAIWFLTGAIAFARRSRS